MTDESNLATIFNSECLTYIIEAFEGITEPEGDLSDEKIALVRIFMYDRTFEITETVYTETQAIQDPDKLSNHFSWIEPIFGKVEISNNELVLEKTAYLNNYHAGYNDCKIVAEAIDAGATHLVTCDKDLIKNLSEQVNELEIINPIELWKQLNIQTSDSLRVAPDGTNPLASQPWWEVS